MRYKTLLRGLCVSAATLALTAPAFAQGTSAQSQACRQQITEIERQMANAPQDRRSELDRMMREARTSIDRNNEAECVRIVGEIRRIVMPQSGAVGQAGAAQGTQIQVQQPAPQVTVERQAPQVSVQQPAPQVTVQQPAPQVTVQQPRPEVTVQQPPPQVTVQQPRPEVTVQQARPEVTVQQQGQPQVSVQRQGEPQVTVQRHGQPQVQVQQPGQAQTQVREPAAGAAQQAQSGAAAPSAFASMRAEQLIGKDIIGAGGQDIGDVEDIVISRQNRAVAAIVGVGGFLGIGERRIAIPLNDLQLQGDRLVASNLTREQIERMTPYEQNAFERFERNRTIGEVMR